MTSLPSRVRSMWPVVVRASATCRAKSLCERPAVLGNRGGEAFVARACCCRKTAAAPQTAFPSNCCLMRRAPGTLRAPRCSLPADASSSPELCTVGAGRQLYHANTAARMGFASRKPWAVSHCIAFTGAEDRRRSPRPRRTPWRRSDEQGRRIRLAEAVLDLARCAPRDETAIDLDLDKRKVVEARQRGADSRRKSSIERSTLMSFSWLAISRARALSTSFDPR